MESYYGGPAGKGFTISKVFHTKVDLVNDINARWSSDIGVGDYVMISYGMPNDLNPGYYNQYEQIDMDAFKKSYNSTLWQKVYFDSIDYAPPTQVTNNEGELVANPFYVVPNMSANRDEISPAFGSTRIGTLDDPDVGLQGKDLIYGLAYKLIGSLTGNTPDIDIDRIVLHANKTPSIAESTPESLDNPIFTLGLPQGYSVPQGDGAETFTATDSEGNELFTDHPYHTILHANQPPIFKAYTEYVTDDEGNPISNLHFEAQTPQGYVVRYEEKEDYTVLHAKDKPEFKIDTHYVLDKNKQPESQIHFKVKLPESYSVPQGEEGAAESFILHDRAGNEITGKEISYHSVLEASENPAFKVYTEYTKDDEGNTVSNLHFTSELPKAYEFNQPQVNTLNAADTPTAEIQYLATEENPSSEIDIIFGLPRAVRFAVGAPVDYLNKPEDFETTEKLYAQDGTELEVGDFFIHAGMGYLYALTAVDNDTYTWIYQCKLQPKTPEATITTDETYDNKGNVNQPVITTNREEVESGEADVLTYNFTLPNLPTIKAAVEFLPSTADNTKRVAAMERIAGSSDVNYTFQVPRGTRVLTKVEEKVNAYDGDLYINTIDGDPNRGQIYQYDAIAKEWPEVGSLRVVNKPLQFVVGDEEYEYAVEEVEGVSIEDTIIETLTNSSIHNDIKEGQIVTVHCYTLEGISIPYWCYRIVDDVDADGTVTLGRWECVQLGVDSENIISNDNETSEYRAFSSKYIVDNYYDKTAIDTTLQNDYYNITQTEEYVMNQLLQHFAWREIGSSS